MRFLLLALFVAGFTPYALAQVTKTPTGIPLDAKWKQAAYAFAQANVVHPSWGLAHGERNFQITKKIAREENVALDEDILFAAAFFHDIGGLSAFEKKGTDHAVRSVEVVEPLLRKWGFPMAKWEGVKELILGHTYYGAVPTSRAAQAFRDADILDFLGSIGVARLLAVTLEKGFADGTLTPTVGALKDFAATMANKCSLESSKIMAAPRVREMQDYLRSLEAQTFDGRAL